MVYKDIEKSRAYYRNWWREKYKELDFRENVRKYRKLYYAKNKERFHNYHKKSYEKNKEKIKKREKERKHKILVELRKEALIKYGGSPPKCICCGETTIQFLCLHHTEGGGNKHRKSIKMIGYRFYLWLKKNNYPKGLQVLCHNCNNSLGFYGFCPHQQNLQSHKA